MLTPNPVVSVVIPNYNHAKYISDAIASVLNQTFRDFEIIVVDDGSTDDSREVVAQFGGRVQYLYQRNAGLSAARNVGIQAARGEYIGVLDADDMYEPVFLESLIGELDSHPDADGIYCGYQFVDEKNSLLPQIENRSIPSEKLYTALLDGNFLVPEAVLVRRNCYDRSGLYDGSLRASEDWDMWLRLAKRYKIIHTTRILTRHRVLAGSMSSDPQRMLTNRLSVLEKHVGLEPEDRHHPDAAKRRAYGRAYLSSCVEYLQNRDDGRAFDYFLKMANVCPELLVEVDTHFRLGCGDQPKGFMGNLASLNILQTSRRALKMLDELFGNAGRDASLQSFQRRSYVSAYIALAMLHYGSKHFKETRGFLLRAVSIDPRKAFNRQYVLLYLKSSLGAKNIKKLKSIGRLLFP